MRAAERLGGFGTLFACGCRTRLTDSGLRLGGDHARRGLVRPEYGLEILAVFTA